MPKLTLINMPYSELHYPSLALTQLKSVITNQFEDEIDCRILYINHDFANFLNISNYHIMKGAYDRDQSSLNYSYHNGGLWDCFFRAAAFPDMPDNINEYFNKFYPDEHQLLNVIMEKRAVLKDYLNEIIDKYRIDDSDIVGFTSMFQQHVPSIAMARMLRQRNNKIIQVIGGPNCDFPAAKEFAKRLDMFDFIFSGPGLISFPKLIEAYLDNNLERADEINGVFLTSGNYRDKPDDISCYGDELDIDQMIDLDYVDYLDSLEKFPPKSINPVLFFETSRGCWWAEKSRCTFCDVNGMNIKYRALSSKKAVKYFESLMKYSDRCTEFFAVDSTIPLDYLTDVFKNVAIPNDITIFYEVRVDMTQEQIKALKAAGITFVQAGIESLSTKNLDLLKKGTTLFDNLMFMKHCCSYGIYILWNILAGIPGEDDHVYNEYIEIIPKITHLQPPSGIYPVSYQRNNEYYRNASQYNLVLKPISEVLEYIYPYDYEAINNISYYFDNSNKTDIFSMRKLKYLQKAINLVEQWKEMWSQDDKRKLPSLYITQIGKHSYVYDSRNGEGVYHKLDALALKILEQLSVPLSEDCLRLLIPEIDEEELGNIIGLFIKNSFIISQDSKLFSLVQLIQPLDYVNKNYFL